MAFWRQVVQGDPHNSKFRYHLAEMLRCLADVLFQSGKVDDYRKATADPLLSCNRFAIAAESTTTAFAAATCWETPISGRPVSNLRTSKAGTRHEQMPPQASRSWKSF